MHPKVKCPRCGQPVEAAGLIDLFGLELTSYQCDTCVVWRDFCGEKFEMAVTFVLDEDGRALDPTSGEPLIGPSEPPSQN